MAASLNTALPFTPYKIPRVAEGELLPVPIEMLDKVWSSARRLIKGPYGIGDGWDCDYDVERLHGRLLLGMDRLWLPAITKGSRTGRFAGVVITSIGPPPKDRPHKLFFNERSLTVHFIAGRWTRAWMPDAQEKLVAYGKESGCRQAFILARSCWLVSYMRRFYGRFERVGVSRDRWRKNPHGLNLHNSLMRPGHFRLLEPMPPGMFWSVARRLRRKAYFRPGENNAA